MTLLEIITKATADAAKNLTVETKHPIILNSDDIFPRLKPEAEDSDDISLIRRVEGWKISEIDLEIIELGHRFFKKLKRKLKNPKSLDRDEFLRLLNSFLEKNWEHIGLSLMFDSTDPDYTRLMIKKLGFLIGLDVAGLILEGCIVFEIWELFKTLIVQKLVNHLSSATLIENLIKKRRSDLLCLCVEHLSDLRPLDFFSILKYFLSPPKDSYSSMISVRKEWESQALLAIEKATAPNLAEKKTHLAKTASILLMITHDGFSNSELCLHYLFGSSFVDNLVLSSSISGLDGSEMSSLIRYLRKWLKKYERFPQAVPYPKAGSVLKLKACDSVPSLESVVRSLGVVLDEHFSYLVLYSECHEELRSIEKVVRSLVSEGRLCCSVTNVIGSMRSDNCS